MKMKLRTGLKTMIGLSLAGIAIAVLLIFTCPFAGWLSFSTLVRVGTHEYSELTVHATAIPTVRGLPVEETWRIGTEASVLGIAVLAVVIGLCVLILRQRRLSLFGVEVPPRALGLGVLLVTFWNLVFAAFLISVEVLHLHEL